MKKAALVSIVIPCYNYGRYLAEAIDSALAQTYESIEIIVIDDGSTDDTREVAARYADRGVRYEYQSNRGISASRNNGAEIAKGEYILFLDADDTLDPEYVRKCAAVMAAGDDNLGMVYTQMKLFGAVSQITDFPEYSANLLLVSNYIHASALMKRSSVLLYPYDQSVVGKEDWNHNLTLIEHGLSAKLINEPLLGYRKHPDIPSRDDKINRKCLSSIKVTWAIIRRHPKLYSSYSVFKAISFILRDHFVRTKFGLALRSAKRLFGGLA